MPRITLSIRDEQKAKRLFAMFGDLDYVEAKIEDIEKVWRGHLPAFDKPSTIPGFKMFTREELHER